jgi:hypothetical protein
LRAYLRQRERLLDYAASHIQHMQKSLSEMNLQLQHVVADIRGATGMRIIRAIISGERNPAVLALLRDTRCHASVDTIEKALTVHYGLDAHVTGGYFLLVLIVRRYSLLTSRCSSETARFSSRTQGKHLAAATQDPATERPCLRRPSGAVCSSRKGRHPKSMAWDPTLRSSWWPSAVRICLHGRVRSTSRHGFVWRPATRYRVARSYRREREGPAAARRRFYD